jgi:hypothetical protein
MLKKKQTISQLLRAQVDGELLRAIESGPATPLTRKDWKRIRAEGLKRAKRRMQP